MGPLNHVKNSGRSSRYRLEKWNCVGGDTDLGATCDQSAVEYRKDVYLVARCRFLRPTRVKRVINLGLENTLNKLKNIVMFYSGIFSCEDFGYLSGAR